MNKQELTRRINSLIWERLGKYGLYPNDYQSGTYGSLNSEEEKEFWEQVRALIEKYGDGGPRVMREEMEQVVQLILEEPDKDYPEPIEENCLRYLRDLLESKGLAVEE